MGIRLVKYGVGNKTGTYNHDELNNRDIPDQHPISSITGLEEVLLQINNDIINTPDIEGVVETNSLKLVYDSLNKTLTGDVKIYEAEDETNAIVETSDGLYVAKTMTEDTNSITWTAVTRGESLSEIFNKGMVFSHNSSSWNNVYSSSEANAWYWDDNLQSFVQPQNTSYFTGFVTKNLYDDYTHTATLTSTNTDNDINGLIVGFVFDNNNKPHTLSIICDSGGFSYRWALIYDYCLPDQQVVAASTAPNNIPSKWQNNFITINVTKHKNLITCTCTDWNGTTLNENTKISVDLNNYSWGDLFNKSVRYGYCNQSQAYSYFKDISFESKNSASSKILFANVKLSSEENNQIILKEDGLYIDDKINIDISQENHGFNVGDFIYYHFINKYQKALGVDDYDINVIGMVTQVTDENKFSYRKS